MDLISCPYNVSHQIRPERIQYHLMKCKEQHPEISLVICPFNAIHHIRKSEHVEHLQNCPDRGIVEQLKYRYNAAVPGQHGNLTTPLVYGSSAITSDNQSEDAEVRQIRAERMRTTKELLMKQNKMIQSNTGSRNTSGRNTPQPNLQCASKYFNPYKTKSEDCFEENSSTVDAYETCDTVNTSFISYTDDAMSIQPASRTRSPSPAPSAGSIPRIYRYGRMSGRTSGRTSPRPPPVVVSELPRPTPLRRPREVFNPRAEPMKPIHPNTQKY